MRKYLAWVHLGGKIPAERDSIISSAWFLDCVEKETTGCVSIRCLAVCEHSLLSACCLRLGYDQLPQAPALLVSPLWWTVVTFELRNKINSLSSKLLTFPISGGCPSVLLLRLQHLAQKKKDLFMPTLEPYSRAEKARKQWGDGGGAEAVGMTRW